MDIYEKLAEDHRRARQTIAELREQAGQARDAVFRRLRRDLEAHVAFEEETFYPAVAEDEDNKDEIDEALAEHDEATALLEELAELDKTSEEFELRLGELEEAIAHHAEEEERAIFAAAREAISDERAAEMARRHDAAMAQPAAAK